LNSTDDLKNKLIAFHRALETLANSSEKQQALIATTTFFNLVNDDNNRFVVATGASDFISQIILLRGGFSGQKMILSSEANNLFDQIQTSSPYDRTKMVTFYHN